MLSHDEFLDMVKQMRAAQKRYFKDRRPADVAASKRLEQEVDRTISLLCSPPMFAWSDDETADETAATDPGAPRDA